MTHYLMSVHGAAERSEFGNYGSKEEMEEAFAATGAFNDKLQRRWLLGLRRRARSRRRRRPSSTARARRR